MKFVEEFSPEEQSQIAAEFSRLNNSHYLDNAGTALYGENQMKQVVDVYTSNFFCNPHTSRGTENIIDQVRLR